SLVRSGGLEQARMGQDQIRKRHPWVKRSVGRTRRSLPLRQSCDRGPPPFLRSERARNETRTGKGMRRASNALSEQSLHSTRPERDSVLVLRLPGVPRCHV